MAQELGSEQVHPVSQQGNGQKSPWFSPERSSHKWWVTVALMLGILTQGLNFGTVTVALPSMMTNLRADVETIQWVVTAFMITRTVAMPAVRWVAAVAGPRTFYLAGLLVYIIGRSSAGYRGVSPPWYSFVSSRRLAPVRCFRCRWRCCSSEK